MDLVVKVTNVAHDGVVLHGLHVVERDHIFVAGGGDEDVRIRDGLVHGDHLVAFHCRLECANGINLGDLDSAALSTERLGTTFAHVAIAKNNGHFAGEHDVGGSHDAVGQGVPATVEVVELALGDRVVDVDGREEQQAHFSHLIQSMHSGGGLFGDAPDGFSFAGEVGRIDVEDGVQQLQHDFVFVVVGGVGRGDFAFLLELDTFVHQKGGIATVIKNEIGLVVAPVQRLESAPPVFFESFALPGEDRDARGRLWRATPDGARGGRMILGGEDVARSPTNFSPQCGECFDEGRGLHGHVQRASDFGTLKRLAAAITFTQCHQSWHFVLGEVDLFSSESEGFSRGAGHFEVVFREQWKAGVEEGRGGRIGGGHVESLGRWFVWKPVHPDFRMKYSRKVSVPQN